MIGDKSGAGVTARVTTRFFGAEDGEVHPKWHEVDAFVRGDLAIAEVAAGRAEWTAPPKLETKVSGLKNPAGPTGEDKPSSSRPAGRAKGKTTSKKRAAKPSSSS